MSEPLVSQYFQAFNEGDIDAMLACLDDDVAHHVNEGQVRVGKEQFAEFCGHMSRCYQENLTEVVVFSAQNGARAAAEYTVNGVYKETDAGLPEANGQTYCLPAGSFFSIADGRINRVVTYYNLAEWLRQVG